MMWKHGATVKVSNTINKNEKKKKEKKEEQQK